MTCNVKAKARSRRRVWASEPFRRGFVVRGTGRGLRFLWRCGEAEGCALVGFVFWKRLGWGGPARWRSLPAQLGRVSVGAGRPPRLRATAALRKRGGERRPRRPGDLPCPPRRLRSPSPQNWGKLRIRIRAWESVSRGPPGSCDLGPVLLDISDLLTPGSLDEVLALLTRPRRSPGDRPRLVNQISQQSVGKYAQERD